MAFCKNCGTLVNDGVSFCPKCGQRVNDVQNSQQQSFQQVQQPQRAYQAQQPTSKPTMPDSHMVWAIFTTIFCCLPTGIYAILQANKVSNLYNIGQYNEAIKAADNAKKWSIISAVLALIGGLISGIMAFIAN